jgi:hypothetical protein
MGPVGFSLCAEEFFLAGASIPQHSRARGNTTYTPVPYYLFCRALELILKAFLLAKHRPLDELKKSYGHDLQALWRAATEQGILDVVGICDPDFSIDLQSANSYYKGKAFEYFDFRRWAHGYQDFATLCPVQRRDQEDRGEDERVLLLRGVNVQSVQPNKKGLRRLPSRFNPGFKKPGG